VNLGNSVLRIIHYPPMRPEPTSVRAGAHEDINVITLLLGAEEPGLEVLSRRVSGCPSTCHRIRWCAMSATCCSG
jgi:isopenicillin N synthase-like dioxygenase